MMYKNLLAILLTASVNLSLAQDITGVLKGIVRDKETFQPIIGAKIEVLGIEPYMAAVTDVNGIFKLTKVPVGKQNIVITYIGYEARQLSNLEVSSKEVVLEVDLVEKVASLDAVEVVAKKKGETINKMVSVSARSFSIDESKRYAGSLNDVSRMAQNFAGARGGNDTRNDVIIRGNSPTGVLYRMEGIDIPNPNHFARFGTTGGPISMLNNNVLANSDFLTGAFPAEYGNAIAGVFDLKLRNGNTGKHEFMFQIGFNGAEVLAEGPLLKKSRASYLVSYRFNDLTFFNRIGLSIGTNAVPRYQDLTVKLNFPHKKGVTSIFGIGGLSHIDILAEEAEEGDVYALDNSNTYYQSNVGIVGVTHKQRVGKKAFFNVSSALQGTMNDIINDTVDVNFDNPFTTYATNSVVAKWSNNAYVNIKLNSKHVIKTGIQSDLFILNLIDSVYTSLGDQYVTLREFDGQTFLFQPYIQHQWRLSERFQINSGIHYQLLSLEQQQILEPRIGGIFSATEKDKFTFGYGLHSQMQPIELYFLEQTTAGITTLPNRSLDFAKSHHFVIGYQRFFRWGIQAKIEAYYQSIYDIVVEKDSSVFSMANYGSAFVEDYPSSSINNGTGRNYGLDITLEKFLDKGLYFLFTSSLYRSFYTPSNGIEYSTAFDGGFTFNALAGYAYKFKRAKKGQNILTFDFKVTRNGGGRYTPILLEESIAASAEIRDNSRAFSEQFRDYFRMDIRIGFKRIGKKITQEWALDMQNITDSDNIFFQEFNPNANGISTTYQTGRLPIPLYRIYF
jgi:hypothetical protein